jgi:hypothetical protein
MSRLRTLSGLMIALNVAEKDTLQLNCQTDET